MSLTSTRTDPFTRKGLGLALLLAIAVTGCAVEHAEMTKARPEGPRIDDGKKPSSGQSYIDATRVELAPVPAAAPGWDVERVASGEDDWEPAVAADPMNPNYIYQLITRYTGPKPCGNCKLPAIVLRRSTDGGATWQPDQFLAQTSKAQYDPQIEVSNNGNVYAVWLDAFTPGSTFTKSTNHGLTWSTGISFAGKGKKPQWNDKPWLIVSRDGLHVYLGFNSSDSYVVASHDGGNTWGTPVKTNNDTQYWFHTGGAVHPTNPQIAYFACSNFANGNNYAGDANIAVLKTTDGGLNWTTINIDISREAPLCPWSPGCGAGYLASSTAMAMDITGKLMILYPANTTAGAPEQMWVRTSTDGVAWSARQQVSVASTSVNNSFPAVAAHPSVANDFRIAWQDDRILSQNGWNTWYKRTTNGGTSWTADIRLSDLTTGAPYKSANGYLLPYGDYFEMGVDQNGLNHLIWGEGTSYTGPGGTWYTRGQ